MHHAMHDHKPFILGHDGHKARHKPHGLYHFSLFKKYDLRPCTIRCTTINHLPCSRDGHKTRHKPHGLWSGWWDLNPRSSGPKPDAIANFATARYV